MKRVKYRHSDSPYILDLLFLLSTVQMYSVNIHHIHQEQSWGRRNHTVAQASSWEDRIFPVKDLWKNSEKSGDPLE